MEDIVQLKWRYTPKDYFEDEIRIEHRDYLMIIREGMVEAHVNPDVYDEEHKMRDSLHQSINKMFLGAQLLTHKPYELSNASMCRLHPDGRKDVTVFPDALVMTMTSSNVDLIVKDKDGNVVSDSRKDRLKKKRDLAELAKTHSSDLVATSMLASYNAAVNDPDNELVYLYEVRDALSKKFDGEKGALSELSLSKRDWKRLGQLANSQPLKQGRHRGNTAGELRDATKNELIEARTIARNFVINYLVYLNERS